MDDFVGMESDLAGDLCTNVDAAVGSLKKVLFGSGLLTPVIQSAATALLSSEVPADWTGRWEGGPEKPQAWLRELVRKRISLMKWRTQSSKGSLLTEPLVLGDLFNPATFVNALRQQTARKLNTAIDRVRMVTSWDKDPMRGAMRSCPLPCTLAGDDYKIIITIIPLSFQSSQQTFTDCISSHSCISYQGCYYKGHRLRGVDCKNHPRKQWK